MGYYFRLMLLYLETNQSWTAELLKMLLSHWRSQNHAHCILLPKGITIFFLASATLVGLPARIIRTMFRRVKNLLKFAPVPLFLILRQQQVDWCHLILVVEVIQKRQIQMKKNWLIGYQQIYQFLHDLSRLTIWLNIHITITISFDADKLIMIFSLPYFCRIHQMKNPLLVA